jgi:hypothetical protein
MRRWAALLLVLVLPGEPASAKDKKKAPPAVAIVAGTVFRPPGFSLAGAEVTLEPAEKPPEAKTPVKVKTQKALSDARGEFAFRVPAMALRYNLSVKAAGFAPARKEVAVAGEERLDVFVTLEPAPESRRE